MAVSAAAQSYSAGKTPHASQNLGKGMGQAPAMPPPVPNMGGQGGGQDTSMSMLGMQLPQQVGMGMSQGGGMMSQQDGGQGWEQMLIEMAKMYMMSQGGPGGSGNLGGADILSGAIGPNTMSQMNTFTYP
jgi:hypothetical protein